MRKFALMLVLGALGCSSSPVDDAQTSGISTQEIAELAELDCTRYDSYLASLGALTVECLGTVDPSAYVVGADGVLRPSFDRCAVQPEKFTKIQQLLSLQQRGDRLPHVKECVATRYAIAQTALQERGVTSCPTWTKSHVINPIDHATIDLIVPALAELGSNSEALRAIKSPGLSRRALTLVETKPELDDGEVGVMDLLEENSLYLVSGASSGPGCDSVASCAAQCASMFPGFVVGTHGAEGVVTDPVAWLTDTTYDKASADPYLRATYYHTMSYYGGVPGVVFGDPARAQPCGPGRTDCPGELCSYYAGSHIKTRLQLDCLIPGDESTCASYCGPPLP